MAEKPRDEVDRVTLTNIKDGAAVELFEQALEEVLANIEDPNFKAKAKRRIALEFEFVVDEDREVGAVHLNYATKLAPRIGTTTVVHFGRRLGALIAVEYDPKQRNLFDPETGADVKPFRQMAGGGEEEATDD